MGEIEKNRETAKLGLADKPHPKEKEGFAWVKLQSLITRPASPFSGYQIDRVA